MKVKKLEIFLDKRGLKGCKWSSLSAQGTENPVYHPPVGLKEFPFLIISPLGYEELASQHESEKVGHFSEQKGFKGMQMVQFKCPRH